MQRIRKEYSDSLKKKIRERGKGIWNNGRWSEDGRGKNETEGKKTVSTRSTHKYLG